MTADLRDALPLPLSEGSAEELIEGKLTEGTVGEKEGLSAWLWLCARGLNVMWGLPEEQALTYHGPLSASQAAMADSLAERVIYFSQIADARVPRRDWSDFLKKHRLNYSGEVVQHAMPLSWEQMEPGLPPPLHCGSIDVLELVDGTMKEFLKDPSLSLREFISAKGNLRQVSSMLSLARL